MPEPTSRHRLNIALLVALGINIMLWAGGIAGLRALLEALHA